MIKFVPVKFKCSMVVVDLVFGNFLNKPFFILIEVLIPEVIHGLGLLFNSWLDN